MSKSKQPPKFVHQIVLNGDRTHDHVKDVVGHETSATQTLWLHIDKSEPSAMAWLESHANLDNTVLLALSAEETRPRSFMGKNGVMVILRGVNTNPGQDQEDMVSIRVWLEQNRVISVWRRPVLSVSDILDDLNNGEGPRTSGEFLVELVNKLANRIGFFVEAMDTQIEAIEDDLETMAPSELRKSLGDLRRQVATVRRYMAPQRDALDRLYYLETQIFSDNDRMRLREESDRISRYLEDLDLARERAVVLQEAFLSQLAQQQNNRVYALSIVTAIFLPLGFVTGLLGINVGGMPGADHPVAFWIVCGGLIVVAIAIWISFRRMKWL